MPIAIRPIRNEERAIFLQRVVQTTWDDLPEPQRQRFSVREIAPNVHRIVEVLMSQGDNAILVADVEGQTHVGQVWLGEAPDPYTGQRRGYIYDLYVIEALRGQGVGRALMEAATAASQARGDIELGLSVSSTNRAAQALYGSFGFQAERLTMSRWWQR